jgi:predicted DNA-binding ribbon-helix-helix protein
MAQSNTAARCYLEGKANKGRPMTSQATKPMPHSASSERPPLELKSAIIKRSIELNGHKTSVSLEDEFWLSLRQIATSTNTGLPALLQKIDSSREGANLSSAIRVHVLNYYRNLAGAPAAAPDCEQRTVRALRS